MTEKYCVKCGKKFMAIGRQVICPACKAAAEEETKRAAVLKAKRASWTGESVPVRISGRASTVIRRYGAANGLPFAAALDDLLKSSAFFRATGKAWEEVEPYRSHRRDKHATETAQDETGKQAAGKPQEAPQEVTSKPQEVKQDAPQDEPAKPAKPVKQAAKKAVKTTSKAAGKKGGKA